MFRLLAVLAGLVVVLLQVLSPEEFLVFLQTVGHQQFTTTLDGADNMFWGVAFRQTVSFL
ncbi:Translation initiation factor IF-2 [Frankliniella fusca]|uniref:Translation initiation factor IF-2 n=1 Tax=Frankliniella fusca TaxID=407009 RepID=A0AAE1HJ26_9NEOP|nr:Translation initiation factor IF-2 [Frankliniella fusca]KAK3914697.1 Translation initiation factor IF-2 [Frankliniella fusca]KAK3922006.1 Translation initiation factor IF-2 [Frankliniella fusca]KAK3922073.1 Translation initiation factor IF-2 [Frankliniella fusca]KAK3922531.1 Translation initiation factor IF-2 [Frankliniella fusca]